MSSFNGLYDIRSFKREDFNFVMATFLRGVYYGDSWFSLMPKSTFMENYSPVASALINRHLVKVACLKDDPDVILGYSILSHDLKGVHWVFVKSAWRKQGIGRSLLPTNPEYVTHLSDLGKDLMKKLNNIIFNPFKLT